MGRTRYTTAIILTFISLVLSQLPAPALSSDFETGQEGQLTAQRRREIINNFRKSYPELLSNLKNVKLECKTDMPETLRAVNEPANGWIKSVELMGLVNRLTQEEVTSEEIERLITDRVNAEGLTGRDYQNRIRNFNRGGFVVTETELRRVEGDRLRREGYSDQAIEEILREAESLRGEFRKLAEELNRLIWDTMKKAYDKAHECCLKEAKGFYLNMMDGIGRQLTINGRAESVSMEKRNECLCAIESITAGQSGTWSGQITHTETFEDERNQTTEGRKQDYYRKHDYRVVINLVYHFRNVVAGASGSQIPAQVSGKGTAEARVATENRWTSSSMDKRQGSETKEDYSGDIRAEETTVEVSIRPDGSYRVHYVAPCVEGSGKAVGRTYVEGTGFPEFQKRDIPRSKLIKQAICPTAVGVLLRDGQHVGIKGQVDPKDPKTLSGTKTFEVPLGGQSQVNKLITITWNLKRCK
jgi:hypothetical protein